MSFPETYHSDFIESQYRQWQQDPVSVSKDWQFFFKGFDFAFSNGIAPEMADTESHSSFLASVEQLIFGYRCLGHMLSCMDPLQACPMEHPLLSLERFGLTAADFDRPVPETSFLGGGGNLKEILPRLKETYCRSIGVEYMHIQDPEERHWLQDRMEPIQNRLQIETAEKMTILKRLYQTALFEAYLNKKYMGVTRFSLEGGDVVIPLLDTLVRQVAENGCREVILGMAHRGRLNVQSHILGKSYEEIFREFESCYDPGQLMGSGDVKYHNGYLADIQTETGKNVRYVSGEQSQPSGSRGSCGRGCCTGQAGSAGYGTG